jgi:hypothetical protein
MVGYYEMGQKKRFLAYIRAYYEIKYNRDMDDMSNEVDVKRL